MAKTKLLNRKISLSQLRARRANVKLNVYRTDAGFEACAYVEGFGTHAKRAACAVGKNPRKAVASALRKFASKLGRRPGAFAGLK